MDDFLTRCVDFPIYIAHLLTATQHAPALGVIFQSWQLLSSFPAVFGVLPAYTLAC